MQSVLLPFYQRVMLWNMCGAFPAPSLKEAAVVLRVIEKVRLTDRESIESDFRAEGGQVAWRLPSPAYGEKLVELENEEAKALAGVIVEHRPVRVMDAEWMLRLIDELNGVAPAATAAGARNGLEAGQL